MKNLKFKLQETASFLRSEGVTAPHVGIILGSGLGILADGIQDSRPLPYSLIPHFPVSTVEGHEGRLVCGILEGKSVMAMQGRFHFYEGYPLDAVTYPVRVMREMGVGVLLVTNAAGGINTFFKAGDLMLIEDHINLLGANPLHGSNFAEQGERFPDMSAAYDEELREKIQKAAAGLGVKLQQGIYAAVTGPSYETPAEVRYLRTIGADAVGMSTVPEVIVANHAGMRVAGISCITNMAAGVQKKKLDHQEVMDTAGIVQGKFSRLIRSFIAGL